MKQNLSRKNEIEIENEIDDNDDPHASFVKFPRTHHLFDTGNSASRDDLIMDADPRTSPFFNRPVTIEEKVDGANLGLSIDKSTLRICAQNRSHFVTSESAAQWGALDTWIKDHTASLFQLLRDEETGVDRILFGEWLCFTHSVPYDKLPGYFIAFDVFDKSERKFLSVSRRDQLLDQFCPDIPRIKPLVPQKIVVSSRQQFLDLLNLKSNYRKQQKKKQNNNNNNNNNAEDVEAASIEGIYIRLDDEQDQFLEKRAKLVRPNFLDTVNTSQHWSKGIVKRNIVVFGEEEEEEEDFVVEEENSNSNQKPSNSKQSNSKSNQKPETKSSSSKSNQKSKK